VSKFPLEAQAQEAQNKRRIGLGVTGLADALLMLGLRYGSDEAARQTEEWLHAIARAAYLASVELAKEKGAFPLFDAEAYLASGNMMNMDEDVRDAIREHGIRNALLTSIAPTGTISLSLANNASNGIEPSFAHHYSRNVIREGKKSKEKVDVYSYELLAYRELVNMEAMPYATEEENQLPDYFISADDITPTQHVDVQAAAQKWIDSSISKTANVPTDFAYDDFKDIYLYAHEQGLKGCTTFRFNPEAFQGVLVKESDLENTTYEFTLEDGSTITCKGNEEIEYDGEIHTAANLYDALKEGYYGKF
jgi:ribonucleoside-diphosphate reductase alpha chain